LIYIFILYLNNSLYSIANEISTDIDDFKLNISQDLAQALRLFEIKVRCNLTDNAFNQIMRASNISISIYSNKNNIKKIGKY
jgi:hypothetical protein